MKVVRVRLVRVGLDRNFNSFLPAVCPFLKMVLCADCSVGRSYFCFLLVVHAVASHVQCTRLVWKCISRCSFLLSVYEYLLKSKFLLVAHDKNICFQQSIFILFLYLLMKIILIKFSVIKLNDMFIFWQLFRQLYTCTIFES